MYILYTVLLILSLSLSLNGQSKISQKVLICGVCRNVEDRLPYTMKIMQDIGELFEDYRIIVYENNSKDNTPKLLKKWMRFNPKIVSRCENIETQELEQIIVNRNSDNSFFRPEEISRARNTVLDMAMSDDYQEYPYLIWMDMDFKIPPSLDGFVEIFESPFEWDAVFAYGIDPSKVYWDWYAFRDATYPIGSELLGNDWWYMTKKFNLGLNDNWHPVYSAFGGCGIYKKSSIIGCRYSALVTDDLEQLAKNLITYGLKTSHPQIVKYLDSLKNLKTSVHIDQPLPGLPKIQDPNCGIQLNYSDNPLLWRMSTFVYQYPSVCEHVTFHASMIMKGHGKLFINPRLIFNYSD